MASGFPSKQTDELQDAIIENKIDVIIKICESGFDMTTIYYSYNLHDNVNALIEAVAANNLTITKYLIETCKIVPWCFYGLPLEIAIKNKNLAMIDLLRSYGAT